MPKIFETKNDVENEEKENKILNISRKVAINQNSNEVSLFVDDGSSNDSDDLFDDYVLAIQLQMQNDDDDGDDDENKSTSDVKLSKKEMQIFSPLKKSSVGSQELINPQWDLIDPCPDIRALFQEFDKKYFWNRLGSCIVEWSKRMTICAGIFYLREGGIIRLSEPLLKYRPRKDMLETLLHEMIHAYLYLTRNFKDRGDHGDEFKGHMRRINKEAGTNITVYHSFHDEVNYQRKHVWRCTGPCREKPPFYGYVKRSMNRAPGKYDTWWSSHESMCSGKFEKISEPADYNNKKSSQSSSSSSKANSTSISSTASSSSSSSKQQQPQEKNLAKIDKFFKKSKEVDTTTQQIESKMKTEMLNEEDYSTTKTTTTPVANVANDAINIDIDLNAKRLEFYNSKFQTGGSSNFLRPLTTSKQLQQKPTTKMMTTAAAKVEKTEDEEESVVEPKPAIKREKPFKSNTTGRDAAEEAATAVAIILDDSIEELTKPKKQIKLNNNNNNKDSSIPVVVDLSEDDVIELLIAEKRVECPVCAKLVDECNINVHVNSHFN